MRVTVWICCFIVDQPGGTGFAHVDWAQFVCARIIGFIAMTVNNEKPNVLTPRERQVATLIAAGMSNKQIARELGVTDGTIKLHVHSIFQKLGAKSRYNLIHQAQSFDAA